ncbi:Protein of unknown function [Cotesia congregata]|uniref:Uncharacterized protein n=1 Tax=Cotesia congregata TaxID=51543 RepID=A0A8J2HBA1_COTCN|nr:Protein of unknown function [Cotesia congregata]
MQLLNRVTVTKDKLRNRMNLPLLSSIIRIEMSLEEDKICCTQFEPSNEMLNFNSSIYEKITPEEEKEQKELLQHMLD